MRGVIVAALVGASVCAGAPPSAAEADPEPVRSRLAESIMIGGELRLRPEGQWNIDLRSDRQADLTYVNLRSRIDVDVLARENLDLFFRVQDSRLFGERVTMDATATTFMKEAWLNWSDWSYLLGTNWDLRVGRQTIEIADERLVGAAEWSNIGRSFDAVRLDARHGEHGKATVFAATTVEGDATGGRLRDDDQDFYGLVLSPSVRFLDAFDLWFLALDDARGTATGGGDREIYTAGGRLVAPIGARWTATAQGNYQFGADGLNRQSAWALHGLVAYQPPIPLVRSVAAEYAAASGDRNAGDRTTGTFDQLFPTNYEKYGIADIVGYRNLRNIRLGARGDLGLEEIGWALDWHRFWRDRLADDAYTMTGVGRGLAGRGGGRGVGDEIDAVLRWTPYDLVEVEAGYAAFFLDGDLEAAIRSAGGAPTGADFAFLQATVAF